MLLDRYKHKLYQSGLKMVLYVSVRELFKCDVLFLHSLDKGLYCQILSDTRLNSEDISRLKDKMTEIINANNKITRKIVTKKEPVTFKILTVKL